MELNIIIFIATIVIIILVTFRLLELLNGIFGWLSSKLARTKKESETSEISRVRKFLTNGLNILLPVSVGLLSLAYCLQGTLLNADFVTAELRSLDMSKVTTELLSQHFSDPLSSKLVELTSSRLPSTGTALSQTQIYGTESVNATLTELWPSLSIQTDTAIHSVYDYFLDNQPDLDVAIPLGNLQEALRQHLKEAVFTAPAPELQGSSKEQIGEYVDAIYAQQFGHLPSELKLSSTTAVNIKHFSISMGDIRRVTIFFPRISTILLALILLLIAGEILVNRNFKITFWNVGIALLASGLVGYLYALFARTIGVRINGLTGLPYLNIWIMHVVTDVLVNINGPVFILLGIGGGMIIISLLFTLIHRARRPKVAEANASIEQ